MTSFDFDIPEKDVAGSAFIMRVGRQLAAAFVRKSRKDKITKAELAARLDLDKAAISRMLRGNSNLTLRSIGELCWAMDVKPVFACEDYEVAHKVNSPIIVYATTGGVRSVSGSGGQAIQVVAQ